MHGVKANEVKIMVIEHTVRPASNLKEHQMMLLSLLWHPPLTIEKGT